MTDPFVHAPVLLGPAVEALRPRSGGVYLDATVGLGGHAAEILRLSAPDGRLWGMDRDGEALARAAERLSVFGGRVRLVHGNFARLDERLPSLREEKLDGILADLGVSSLQLDDPARGFSFQREGPLDMRMDRSQGETALSYLQRALPEELAERLSEAGEGRQAKRLARFLLEGAGQWRTTADLERGLEKVLPRWGATHPATRVFLALRLAVNREMESLREFLGKAPLFLKPGGRLAVISFHSTEDRIVKRAAEGAAWKRMRAVTRSPVAPGPEELERNPRSRSAKLRVFEKEG